LDPEGNTVSDKLLKTAVKAQTRVRGWRNTTADAMRRRADEGQSAVEYMGIIVVVVAIIIAILNTNFGARISAEITEQIEKITSK
jgi:pilus assembly protein Flp/PilA